MSEPVWSDASGTASANGTFTFKAPVQQAHWFVGKLVGKLPGAARTGAVWEVSSSGRSLDFGLSSPVSIGPLILQPGEIVTLSVTGLVSGDAVNAQFVGKATDDAAEAIAAYVPTANPLNSQVLPLVLAALQQVTIQGVSTTAAASTPPGVFVTGSGASNQRSSGWAAGLDVYDNALLVSRRTTAPADWEVALAGAVINNSIANGSFAQIIAAPLNQRIIVHWAEYSFVVLTATNAGGNLQDDSGAVILSRYSQRAGVQDQKLVRGPVKLPLNQGLRLTNDDIATSQFIIGAVLYTLSSGG